MFVKRLLVILNTFAVALLSVIVCYAESNVVLFQAYAWEQNIDVYVAGDMNPDNLSYRVSNQTAEIVGSGLLADGDITVRTTILIDISTSMPTSARGTVVSYINSFIENLKKNEQLKIVTFGEQLTVLHDFTSDRYDLSIAAGKITFDEKESKIYDAIFNTIPQIKSTDNLPCYYRTIVITDGVDNTARGITREELYLKLQAETYPIDVIEVTSSKQAETNKDLAALTRISNGRYANLFSQSEVTDIVSSLNLNGVFWIRAIIPETLLDGSTRQINISDGAYSLQFDMKIPVFDVPAAEISAQTEASPTETPLPTPSESLTTDPVSPAQPSGSNTTAATGFNFDMFGDYTIVIFIGIGVGVIIAIAIIVALIIARSKKKRKSEGVSSYSKNAPISKETKILGADSSGSSGDVLCVRLRNTSNPDQIWSLSLANAIIIGRDTKCQVCIDDGSMSRQQCKLYLVNNVPMLENISNANVTQLNGEKLLSPHSIKEGDKIKCGRVTVMVDSLYGSDSSNVGNLNKMTGFVNV